MNFRVDGTADDQSKDVALLRAAVRLAEADGSPRPCPKQRSPATTPIYGRLQVRLQHVEEEKGPRRMDRDRRDEE